MGNGDHAIFGQKLLNTRCGVGRCTCKSPTMKWGNTLNVIKENSLKLKAASHNNASWHTDTGGFLELTQLGSLYYKGPALQKIILGFGGSPLIYTVSFIVTISCLCGILVTINVLILTHYYLQSILFPDSLIFT